MKIDRIETIIARRSLQTKGGREVQIIVGRPEHFPDEEDFYCPFSVNGLGDDRVRYAGGVDALQALILALKMLSVYVMTLEDVKQGDVQWLDGSDPTLGLLLVP